MATENQKETLVSLEGICKYFNVGPGKTLKAVDGITMNIYKGETLGVVGESGCGKSTLGRVVMGIYHPTKGKLEYEGKAVNLKHSKARFDYSKKAQIVFQDPYASLNPRMTVGDIIAEGMEIHKMYDKEKRKQRVYELLETVGLNREHANRFPHEFSGGQRQRIGIARALIMNPEFIIADEPISALDVSIRAQVLNLMSQLQKERGLTYLFISHDLSVMRFICDRIAVVHKGLIVEMADTETLFRHPAHPYTRALLSAIPQPNPDVEKKKVLEIYDPSCHHYEQHPPRWQNIEPGHQVLCNDEELAAWKNW